MPGSAASVSFDLLVAMALMALKIRPESICCATPLP